MLGLRDQADRPPDDPRLKLASTQRIDAQHEVVADFLRRVMRLDAAQRVLADGTTLWNLHLEESNSEFVQRAYFVYGVDISDIQPPYLCEIAERIARHRADLAERQRADSHTRLTYDDLLHLPDNWSRRELIDGELLVTPPPNARHQVLLGRLFLGVGNYLAAHPATGRALLSPFDVVFSPHDVVEPDLLFVAQDQLEIVTPTNVQGSPALVVEILSPDRSRPDEQAKRGLLSRTAVREYWIVDPDSDSIEVSRRAADGSFARTNELTAGDGDTLTSPLLPDFSLPLTEFFAPTL